MGEGDLIPRLTLRIKLLTKERDFCGNVKNCVGTFTCELTNKNVKYSMKLV